jgi:hypothetical protein
LRFALFPESGTEKLPRAIPLFPALAGRNVIATGLAGDSLRGSTAPGGRDRAEPGDILNPALELRTKDFDKTTSWHPSVPSADIN